MQSAFRQQQIPAFQSANARLSRSLQIILRLAVPAEFHLQPGGVHVKNRHHGRPKILVSRAPPRDSPERASEQTIGFREMAQFSFKGAQVDQ